MNYTNLKEAINAVIKTNGSQAITGQVLQNVLNTLVTTMGANRTFVGVATPDTVALSPLPDGNVFYITKGTGLFTSFNVTVPAGKVCILYNTATAWAITELMDDSRAINRRVDMAGFSVTGLTPSVGAVNGATVDGRTLVIPVGETGNGSNCGNIFKPIIIPAQYGIGKESVQSITIATVFKVTGAAADIANIKPYQVQFWNAIGGVFANVPSSDVDLFYNTGDGTITVMATMAAIPDEIERRKQVATWSQFYVGISWNSTTPLTQELRIENLTTSHAWFEVNPSVGKSFSNIYLEKQIENAKTEINNTLSLQLGYFPQVDLATYKGSLYATTGTNNVVVLSWTNTERRKADIVAGTDPAGFVLGSRSVNVPANRTFRYEGLYRITGSIEERLADCQFYCNYYVNGNRTISVATIESLGNNLYHIYKDVTGGQYPLILELFGLQYIGSGAVAAGSVEYLGFSANDITGNADNIENANTQRLNAAFGGGKSTQTIIVSADESDTDAAFTGKNAIQLALNSISDNSATNRYVIKPKPGLYKITNSSEFLGLPGYPCMILMKDYVDIIGVDRDNTIIWAELPYNDADIDTSITGNKIDRILHQTVWNYANDAKMANVTLVAKNLRYVVHEDSGNAANKSRSYENVKLIFQGDKGLRGPWGLGTWDGEENYVVGGGCTSYVGEPYSVHNNTKFTKPTIWDFTGHEFTSVTQAAALSMYNAGSLLNDELRIKNCSLNGAATDVKYTDIWLRGTIDAVSFDHAEYRLLGWGNSPFLFQTDVLGQSLRITSKSTGANSKVRFLASGDAYNALIKNPRMNSVSLYIPQTQYVDSYIAFDGSTGLSGWANGCCDVTDKVYKYESQNYCRMGLRLGNCSTTTKTLTIIVDGTNYNVVFNKDYTNMSNADILAEINAVISAVATATLVYYGRNYYPEMPDVMERVCNNSSSAFIPKGTILTRQAGLVRPANEGEPIAGVALDDIPVYSNTQGVISGWGRMLKRGYIATDMSLPFFVLCSKTPAIGDKFKVSAGQLVVDANGTVTTRKAGVVAINCN